MKIHAIATLATAAAVSLFQAVKPEPEADGSAVFPEVSVSEEAAAKPRWGLLPGEDRQVRLMQAGGEAALADPLAHPGDGAFPSGGVVQLVERDEPLDFGAIDGMVVDVVEPVLVPVVDTVGEVNVLAAVPRAEDLDDAADAADVETGAVGLAAVDPLELAGIEEVDPGALPGLGQPRDPSEYAEVPVVVTGQPGLPGPGAPQEAAKDSALQGLADRVTQAVGLAGGEKEEEAAEGPTIGEDEGGFWLRAAKLNEVFQYLARLAGLQYFHNADLEASNYVVTGHLADGDPVDQMEELGLMYGITVHRKGNTIYAMTAAQLAQLPTKPFYYQLKYLRPSDIDQIKGILQPVLTPGSGTVDYEPKTNTLIVIDNEKRIESIRDVLAEVDRPKQQIAIETRILRVNSSARNRLGVDWESVLGDGLTFRGESALNALFNLPDSDQVAQVITTTFSGESSAPFTITDPGTARQMRNQGTITGVNNFAYNDETVRSINSTESQLVLSPLQLQATLRALNTGGLAHQESSPTLITEDNEAGIISIIDRIPIIISTVSETTTGQNVTDVVRYRIDDSDPSFSDDPANSREIGVTISVTPTILPDNTVRMALRPRSAQITAYVESQSGNLYPRVNESTVDTIARVPNGYSLLIGGFYEEQSSELTKKVPILGDIPGLNFMFKSTDHQRENTSLVFVVTPKLYEPARLVETDRVNREIHEAHVLPSDHAWPDRTKPGFNYEPNLGWAVGNTLGVYPPVGPSNPLHPEHPVNLPEWDVRDEPGLRPGQTLVEPAAPAEVRRGIFGNRLRLRNR